jgi:osmotically-inducible protein OsmY
MKSDSQIQKDVLDELKRDPILNSAEIGVRAKNGVVTLSGIVDSYSKKLAAENDARKIAGVKAIAGDI